MDADIIIHFGAAVKAMGEGRVGGYVVRYGGPEDADADGEWFTPETDFDTEFPARVSVLYNHGLDPAVGRRRLAYGSIKQDETGLWVEAQLDLADRYQAAMYRLAAAGKLGWSSGAVAHRTEPPREAPGGAIKSWPGVAHDASLTPIPSDRRNLAIALKSWEPPPLEELAEVPTASLAEATERVTDTLEALLGDYRTHAMKAGRKLSAARRERLARVRQLIDEMLSETEPHEADPDPEPAEPAPAPVMGGGARTGTLPDVNDLYTQACRQLDGCLLPLNGSPS